MAGALDSPKHEAFCAEYVRNGCNGAEAYRKTYGKGREVKDANKRASELLRRNADIAERVRELQRAGTSGAVMSASELMTYLTSAIKVDPDTLTASSPLVQSIRYKDGKPLEFKVVDKLRAAELLAKLAGMVTDKLEVVDKTPREPISELRARVAEAMGRHGRS